MQGSILRRLSFTKAGQALSVPARLLVLAVESATNESTLEAVAIDDSELASLLGVDAGRLVAVRREAERAGWISVHHNHLGTCYRLTLPSIGAEASA